MPLFTSILVPTDLTERNREAVAAASGVVAPRGTIYLLHVIETIPGLSVEEEKDFYEKLERNASAFLERLGAHLDEANVRWSAEVVYGSRARAILEEAKKLSVDLIVVRSHRVEAEPQHGFGTLSYQVGVMAECSVLLVK